MAKKHAERSQKSYGYYIKLGTLLDLARSSCSIGIGASHINAIKQGSRYRLFSIGEKLDSTRLLYCLDVDSRGDALVYNPNAEEEECEFKDVVPVAPEDYKKYKIPVVELSSSVYTIRNKLSDAVTAVRVKGLEALVKSIVSDTSGRTETVKLYSFFYNAQHIIGTFSLFRDVASKTFAYTSTDAKGQFGYLRYNYLNDSVEFCHSTAEKPLIYLRIINLAEPFPFFKSAR
jgi:hypothetical protein